MSPEEMENQFLQAQEFTQANDGKSLNGYTGVHPNSVRTTPRNLSNPPVRLLLRGWRYLSWPMERTGRL